MKIRIAIFFVLFYNLVSGQIYQSNDGQVKFVSDAPLEIIQAESEELGGVLNLGKKTFGFKLSILSFQGFNSPLQQIHFYENYLEAKKFPTSTFQGKIIEDIQLDKLGLYRAKGQLDIHGISREVIIDVWLKPKGNHFLFESDFKLNLSDYEIDLPRIVYQKIAENIDVHVYGKLVKIE